MRVSSPQTQTGDPGTSTLHSVRALHTRIVPTVSTQCRLVYPRVEAWHSREAERRLWTAEPEQQCSQVTCEMGAQESAFICISACPKGGQDSRLWISNVTQDAAQDGALSCQQNQVLRKGWAGQFPAGSAQLVTLFH